MAYAYYKALHIIFVVTWFAGLFYIVRLFIYHVEALEKAEPEKSILANQFKVMQKRLMYGITWPSMFLTVIFGSLLLANASYLLKTTIYARKTWFCVFISCLSICLSKNNGELAKRQL